jgi:Peptidase family S41
MSALGRAPYQGDVKTGRGRFGRGGTRVRRRWRRVVAKAWPRGARRAAALGPLLVALLVALLAGCTGTSFARSRARQPAVQPEVPPGAGPLNDAQYDLLYLARVLRDTHPDPYGAAGRAAFDEAARRASARLAGASKAALELEAQRFLARLGDAHTEVVLTSFEASDAAPFRVTPLSGGLYITDVKNDQTTRLLGTRLLTVNGRAAADLLPVLESFASCENDVCRRLRAARWLTDAALLRALTGVDPSRGWRLRVARDDGRQLDYVLPASSSAGWRSAAKPHPVTGPRNDFFSYQILADKRVAYLQLNRMYDRRSLRSFGFPLSAFGSAYLFLRGVGNFTDLLDDLFVDAARARVDTLVVDLRHNRGGSSALGHQLLYYLHARRPVTSYGAAVRLSELARLSYPGLEEDLRRWPGARPVVGGFTFPPSDLFADLGDPKSDDYVPPPAVPFRGHVVYLVGPDTFSAGAELATLARDNGLGLIVGQSTSQRPTSFGDKLFVELPRTKVLASISYKRFVRPDSLRHGELALAPDVEIGLTAAHVLGGQDPAWDWILAHQGELGRPPGAAGGAAKAAK